MYFDGGCRPNPGEMNGSVIFSGDVEDTVVESFGHGTNNLAEWCAVVYGLRLALQHGITDLVVVGDSQLVINQLNGVYKVKCLTLQGFYNDAREMLCYFNSIEFNHVLRDSNKAGIYLEKNWNNNA